MKLNKYKNTEIVDDVVVPELNTEENTSESEEQETLEFNPIDGVVTGCSSLYVRSASHSNASPIDVINGGTIIKIIGEDNEFWKIEKPEGFVMKKFIKVI